MKPILLFTVLASVLGAFAAQSAPTVDDLAKFVAGVPAKDPGLEGLQKESWWTNYSAELNKKWAKMDERQLTHVRSWASGNAEISRVSGTVYYMFSGPDYLYARTFFPNASTYILCGTEPVGSVPDISKMATGNVASDLSNVRKSLDTMLTTHYFITKDMRVDLTRGYIGGTLPLLYVFLEKSGCFINSVNLNGSSVQINFHSPSGKAQTLYYFKTDLSNGGGNDSFLAFCKKQGPGASLLKSASYLMHEESFSKIRNFLLANSSLIVQDDSGIPYRAFDQRRWNVKLYGVYDGPIGLFSHNNQPDLAAAYQKSKAGDLGFAFGYAWQVPKGLLIEATPK
ncbi:MAG: hypothetical protein ABJF10_01865 [Chthoniobacter sp.]|uniref:hypothetical protein n=1 Tax=Chthoniobacter sp. TaxID=2510640 RepID=UPI0032AB61BB